MTVLYAIRGFVLLAYILIISPYLLGTLLCCKLEGELVERCSFRYVTGFFSQIGVWGCISLPVAAFAEQFIQAHILYYAFLLIIIAISVCSVIFLRIRFTSIRNGVGTFFLGLKRFYYNGNLLCKVSAFALFFIVILHMFMAIYGGWDGYDFDDDARYIPEIVQGISRDTFVLTSIKRILAPWIYYMNMLSFFSGQHPIFICRTVIGVQMYVIEMLVLYLFARFVFNKDVSKILFMLLGTVIVVITFRNSWTNVYSMGLNPVIWWGKIMLYTTGIPLIYVLYFVSRDRLRDGGCLLIFAGMGVAWMTLMSAATIPLGIGSIVIFDIIKHRTKNAVLCGFSLCVGSLVQVAVYLYLYLVRYVF